MSQSNHSLKPHFADTGKSTLAKTTYNLNFDKFDGSSFLADANRTLERHDGLLACFWKEETLENYENLPGKVILHCKGNPLALKVLGSSLCDRSTEVIPYLKTLILKDCIKLARIYESIGFLDGLVYLNLRDCKNLRNLPESFCMLKSLEKLIISRCSKLVPTVIELGKLESLTTLQADGINFGQLAAVGNENSWRCLSLKSQQELLPSLITLKTVRCSSLETVTNLPNLMTTVFLDVMKSESLSEISGIFKLNSIDSFEVELLNILILFLNLDENRLDTMVEIFNRFTSTKRIYSVQQGLYEFGIFSNYFPENEVPRWFSNKSEQRLLTCNVDSLPNIAGSGAGVEKEDEDDSIFNFDDDEDKEATLIEIEKLFERSW
ncbi:hypothetical protein T459_26903 [Capsicum annuum]|uniref:Uncharacterized protein n=1 Tax=Capsicum annuum TaxID=4072 RepID=A0A2G2YCE9_CAPAN|nr:hypothetical protein T459_26903 [Capsicum annuum]